ncbi:uncharacterized protein LOC115689049 isoform X1 [Syzygium oleosum]|uniref:uncharacterized protein LOC115689049 isoform X1 n=1 Tax=Syzygium oleosum TaxID=219896 RepID=UPI0011D1DEC2|nr:uncharacterized protein LOC115689049 isoform X1 [Syzygium oleosum]
MVPTRLKQEGKQQNEESHPPNLAQTSESGKLSMTGNERVAVQASHSRRFKKRKQVKLKRSTGKRRENAIISPLVKKYWLQRYHLFSRYDEGVKLDEEGWYSVTPEEIAVRHAERCRGRTVIDCFAGVGGNAIQFAILCHHVVAIDIDPQKIELAFHNAKIYGVEDRIDFVVGDFFQLAPSLKGDIVYLSPPWGGPSYKMIRQFNLDLLKPKDGYSVFQAAQRITPNIIMFLPRNMDLNQVEELSWLSSPPLHVEIEENYVDGKFKGITAYFNDVTSRQA